MTDDQLLTFITVTKYLNYSRAAEELNVAQPTITARIKTLEIELDCSLFNRNGYSLALTSEGEVLLDYANSALNFMNQARTAVQYFKKPSIKIGFAPAFSSSIILSTLNDFKKENDVNIYVFEAENSDQLLKKLQNKEIDIGFTRRKENVYSNLEAEYLSDDKLVLMCTKQKFSNIMEISKNNIDGETIIVHKRNSHLWDFISKELLSINYFDNIEVSNTTLLKSMVKEGWGSALIHSSSLDPSDSDELKLIPFTEPFFSEEHKVYAVYNKENYTPDYFNKVKQNFLKSFYKV